MLFNSIDFLIFLFIVYFLYWFVFAKKLAAQNIFLLTASYVFYAWWNWHFLFLLIFSTLIDYFFGILIYQTQRKKLFLWLSIVNNFGILIFFKYYNFFAESVQSFLSDIGWHVDPVLLNIALPVGISFYTFHGMSYVIDIYRGKITPTRNFINYAVFVCFFPLLVAGPIERAWHLLPQVEKPRKFDYRQSTLGLRLMLWGFFKKIVIADSLSVLVSKAFNNYHHASGVTLIMGAVYFAVQIYCDFSGYTDIARGTAKLLGIELLINFKFPYFSRDIAEFWRRWHISLSSWFRDYLYIPLGGSKNGKLLAVRNTFIIFLVSGFWHGANWTFIFWGLLHAVYFLPLLLLKRNRVNTGPINPGSALPSLKYLSQVLITFSLVCLAWIFFRAATITDAFLYIKSIATNPFFKGTRSQFFKPYLILLILMLFTVEWITRNAEVEYFFDRFKNNTLRYSVYFLIVIFIFLFGSFGQHSFIYFQF